MDRTSPEGHPVGRLLDDDVDVSVQNGGAEIVDRILMPCHARESRDIRRNVDDGKHDTAQLAGMADQPATMAESTPDPDPLNTYTRGVLELDGVQAALDEAAKLLDRARSARIPIFHVAHDGERARRYDVRADMVGSWTGDTPRGGTAS